MEVVKISVVIPSYNSQDTIGTCLEAINKQSFHPNFEIIIVDSSPGDTVDQTVQKYPNILFIKESQKTLPGIGRNVGAGRARGELLVFLDSDVVLEESALEKIWDFYKKGYKIFSVALNLDRSHKITWVGLTKHLFYKNEYQENRKIESRNYLGSSVLICETSIFKKEEGFKGLPQAEDMEFTERMSRKGYKLFFISEIVAYLIHDETILVLLRKIFRTGFYIYLVRYKRAKLYKRLMLIVLLPLITLIKAVRIVFRNATYLRSLSRVVSVLMSPIIFFYGIFWMLGIYVAFFEDLIKTKSLI